MGKFLFGLATTGWILGLSVHLLALSGVDVQEKMPFVFLLHVGVFVVWIPTIIRLVRRGKDLGGGRSNPIAALQGLKVTAPIWLLVIAGLGFVYAIVNFWLFAAGTDGGSPSIENGQYILHNHGKLVRILTEQEYHGYRANELRGFSGHWMAFYGVAVAVLWPFEKSEGKK